MHASTASRAPYQFSINPRQCNGMPFQVVRAIFQIDAAIGYAPRHTEAIAHDLDVVLGVSSPPEL